MSLQARPSPEYPRLPSGSLERIRLLRRNRAVRTAPDAGTLFAEIEQLSVRNRAGRDPATERRIRELRHEAGAKLAGAGAGDADFAEPDYDALPDGNGIPEVSAEQLTPALLRAAMLRHGSLLVRGIMEHERATAFAKEIETA